MTIENKYIIFFFGHEFTNRLWPLYENVANKILNLKLNILENLLVWSLKKMEWFGASKPDFLNLTKIGKPYSIDLRFLALTVLENALSEKSIFSSVVTFKINDRSIISDSPSLEIKKNLQKKNRKFQLKNLLKKYT